MRPSSSPSEPPAAGLFDAVLARGPVPALVSDAAWLQAMLDAEAALARAEAAVGIFPAAYAEAIATACHADRYDVTRLSAEAADSGNPVIPLVRALTALVQAAAGDDAAGWVHFGATSQDVLDTATGIVAGHAGTAIVNDLRNAGDAAARLARDHATTLMAGRTLLQQATPTTFGLAAATWLDGLDRATDDVWAAVSALPVQLGGATGTLASLGPHGVAVLGEFARQLGLSEPVVAWHTSRVPVARFATALGVASGAIAKVAGDVVHLAQTEIGEVSEGNPARGGSSTMPHKRNPVAAVSALAGARQAPGLVATLLASMEQEHQRAAGAWHAEWQPLRSLLVSTGSAAAWLADCLSDLQVDAARMGSNLGLTGGLVLGERISTALQPAVGRLEAHDLVAAASRRAVEENIELLDVLLATSEIRDHLKEDDLRRLMDPATYLGSAAVFVDRAVARHEALR
jgi:3-carboxy-cis,cis-muconate cycloisomerase